MTLRAIAFLIFAFLFGGCAEHSIRERPELPESLGSEGLVIAEVLGVGRILAYMSVGISGSVRGRISLYHLAISLPPGEYTLDALFSKALTGSTPTMAGTMTTYLTTNLPIRRKFSIRAGEVTNLGQLVLIFDSQGERSFTIHTVDNSADLSYFLKTHYPKLLASLKPNAVRLAPGSYATGEELQKLRGQIATSLATRSKDSRYVSGAAGTLALVDRDPGGKVRALRLLETDFTAGIVRSSQRNADRVALVTSDGRFFVARSGRLEPRPALPVPVEAEFDDLFAVGERQVLIARKGFELFASNDDGHTWQHHPALTFEGDVSWRTRYGVVEGREGYYVYQTFPGQMVFSPQDSTTYQLVSLPQDAPNIRRVTLRGSDLFLESWLAHPYTGRPYFFVRARAGGDWQKRSMPKGMCDPIDFLDDDGKRLRTQCAQGTQTYVSDDGGLKWVPR